MKKTQLGNSLLLLITAAIWGSAFVAQSVGMGYVKPFTFTSVRSFIGGLVLIPCIFFLGKWKKGFATKVEWIGGACCGTALCIASNFQQFGMESTTVGKAGFITALYVVLVPIFGIFLKKRVSLVVWGCVGMALVGLYFLCIPKGEFYLAMGDLLVMICAILFTIHILVIDHFSPKGDGVIIACIQFFVCGILSAIPMFLGEQPSMGNILDAKWAILYAGVLSSGVAYTLQVVAQKNANPTVASLILSLEAVFAVLAGWLVLEQNLSNREKVGCILMFVAIILAQIPMPEQRKEDKCNGRI